jgi:hypothetical protein
MLDLIMIKKNHPRLVLVAAFLLACVHNYLFFGNLPGISYPLFIILFYLYIFTFMKEQLRFHSIPSWLLFAVIVLLSMTYVLYNNPILYTLNFLLTPVLIFIHITFIGSKSKFEWSSIRLIVNTLDHLIPQSLRHVPTAFRMSRSVTGSSISESNKSVISRVLIGLSISIPLLIIVIGLLASADRVFEHFLTELPQWLNDISIGEGIARSTWVFIMFLLLFGYLWGFIDTYYYRFGERTVVVQGAGAKVTLDPIIVTTVLTCMNMVYVLFVVVQFSYLFGAWEGIIPEGSTFAEHARSGFFELVFVTMINFGLLVGTLFYARKDKGILHKFNDIMLTLLVGCSSVMLYSAYIRLHLYEEAYGYTYIRFLVHAFMIYLAVLLVIAGLRIWMKQISLTRLYIIISLLAYVIVNYIGMDRMIAEKNIARYEQEDKIDVDYLLDLSTDAIPLLITFSQQSGTMDEQLQGEYTRLTQVDRNWPSFNFSRYRAERELSKYFNGKVQ